MTEIRTDVAIDVHPDALLPRKEALDIDGTPGQRAYGVARGALATIYAV